MENLSGNHSGSGAEAPSAMHGKGACMLQRRYIRELLSLRISVRFRYQTPQPWFIWCSFGHVRKQNARQLENISDKSLRVYVFLCLRFTYQYLIKVPLQMRQFVNLTLSFLFYLNMLADINYTLNCFFI